MLLMVEKGIRGGICHSIYQYTTAINKYMKDYDKSKECSYIQYWDINNLYVWAMLQKLPVNNFEWMIYTSQFKDTLKAFNDFRNNQQKSTNKCFLICKSMYILKVYSVHYTLR